LKESVSIPHVYGRFTVPHRVLAQSSLSKNCHLYGRVIRDGRGAAVVFSVIPTDAWNRAYLLTVNTPSKPGSYKQVLDAICNCEINVYQSRASAISSSGELCVAAVIVFPSSSNNIPFDETNSIEELKLNIWHNLTKQKNSPSRTHSTPESIMLHVYKEYTNLQDAVYNTKNTMYPSPDIKDIRVGDDAKISISKLNYLAECIDVDLIHGDDAAINCEFDVKEGEINLSSDCNNQNIYKYLYNQDEQEDATHPGAMLWSLDTEGCYSKIAVLPRGNYIQVTVPIEIVAEFGDITGTIAAVISKMLNDKIIMNIYYSAANVVSRKQVVIDSNQGDTEYAGKYHAWKERINLEVVGRITGELRAGSISDIDVHINNMIVDCLENHLENYHSNKRAFALISPNKHLVDKSKKSKTIQLEEMTPYVFVASNIKSNMPQHQIEFFKGICRLVRRQGCRPIMIDKLRVAGISYTSEQIIDVVNLSTCMISVFFPEDTCRVECCDAINSVNSSTNSRTNVSAVPSDVKYAANAWVIFEECCMIHASRHDSKNDASLIRVIHRQVWRPPYYDEVAEIRFGDNDSSDALRKISEKLRNNMRESSWHNRFCETIFARRSVRDRGWLNRLDPESWLDDESRNA
jgi:hypothetical protein